jgi:hypothetical protein
MPKLMLYIPTRARVQKQRTFNSLPKELQKRVTIVCPPDEVAQHEAAGRRAVGCPKTNIGETRDWILDLATKRGERYIMMLDDDFKVQVRRDDDRTPSGVPKITDATPAEVLEAFKWVEDTLKEVAHCSFGARSLSPDVTGEYKEPMKALWSLAYDMKVVNALKARFCKGMTQPSTMEDYNITLQLLTHGYPNRVSLVYRMGGSTANSKGGCSTWRTTPIQTASAHALKKLFPAFVELRPKKEWQGMEEGMMDVTVQWVKALKYGQLNQK